ncbi:hypothetical protein M3Y99_01646100 [Aphelenchoides fujianensis]|nr:hypothetical protein M3Y99_01646100 [Aphelenchoides fujianensis]
MAVRSWSPGWPTTVRLIALLQLFFGDVGGQTVSILPFNGAFVLRRPTDSNGFAGNNTRSNELYFQNGCPSSADQKISTQIAGHSYVLPVYPRVHNLYCSVNVRLAQDRVHLDRPYVDIIASRDPGWMSVTKHRLCVTVQLTNAAGASVGGSCVLNERYEPFCLIRQIVPYSWFQLQDPQPSEHLVSVSYSVKSHCAAAEIPLSNQRLRLLSTPDRFSVFALSTQPDGQLSLLTRPNLTFSTDSMSTIIFHYKQSPKLNASEMWIDPRFEIVSASLLDPKKWEMKAESAADAQRHVTFTLTPTESEAMDGGETYLFAMLLRMRSEQERGGAEAKPPPNVHASIVVYWMRLDSAGYVDVSNQTESGEHLEYNGRISRRLVFGVDSPYIVVPIMKSNDLVNVAVITGLQMSTPMRILSISDGGKIRDITDQSQCVSAEPRVLKVSPTCSSVFVDGSESRGLADVFVHVQYKSLRSSAAFNVWFPRLPITVWISDRTLNSVNDWRQAEVRILAAFQVVDELSGDITYLSGSPELLFDLTQVSMDRVQSSDPGSQSC